jgi:hypothetical protein
MLVAYYLLHIFCQKFISVQSKLVDYITPEPKRTSGGGSRAGATFFPWGLSGATRKRPHEEDVLLSDGSEEIMYNPDNKGELTELCVFPNNLFS